MLGHSSLSEAPLSSPEVQAGEEGDPLAPPAGELSLEGFAPFVSPAPSEGSLTLQGFAPSFDLNPARVTKAGAYAILGDGPARITKVGSYIIEGTSTDRRVTKTGAYLVEGLGTPCGAAPHLSAGNVTTDSAELLVDLLEEYIDVRYETYDSLGNLVDFNIKSGTGRFIHVLSGLDSGTTYISYARVRRDCGWSPRSDGAQFTTLTAGLPDSSRGCPPAPRGWHQNPDANPPRHNATGFYKPLPGEPLSGTVECVLRWTSAAQIWDIFISDDLGDTWTQIEDDLEHSGEVDGDNFSLYKFTVDTTALADGQDYRLRASSQIEGDDTVIDSVSFPIDNAGDVHWWRHDDQPLDGRFGVAWTQSGGGFPGLPAGTIWARGPEGGIAAVGNQHWSAFVDLEVPTTRSLDATISHYVFSGEGGFFGLGGRDDTEQVWIGLGMQIEGESSNDTRGIFGGIYNPRSWPLGCCDDYLTSSSARMVVGRTASIIDPLAEVGSGADTVDVPDVKKMFFKALANPTFAQLGEDSPRLSWRNGPFPGDSIVSGKRTCGRRYEMYSQRIRLVVDEVDDTLAQLSIRLDGPGVEEPDSGYWHFDEQVDLGQPAVQGAVGFVSRHVNPGSYSAPLGARVLMTWSVLPLEEGPPPDIPPEEEPPELPVGDPAIDLTRDCEELVATGSFPAEIAEDLDESRWRFYDLDSGALVWDTGYQSDDLLTITFDLVGDSPFVDLQGTTICGTVQFRDSSTGEETAESERDCVAIPNLLEQHEVVIDNLTADSVRLTIRDVED